MPETARSAPYQIHSEPRGAHWVAWVSHGDQTPCRGVVVVGETREEAEAHARTWAEHSL
jgi:hypothetical protein